MKLPIKNDYSKGTFKKIISTKEELKSIIEKKHQEVLKSYDKDTEWLDFCNSFNEKYDYSKITNMSYLFEYNTMKVIPHLKTKNVTNMYGMFFKCENLKTIPQLDTRNVINMSAMFSFCTNLETIPQLNTSKVKTMNTMFSHCINLKEKPKLDTSKVTNKIDIYYNCKKIEEQLKTEEKKLIEKYNLKNELSI